MNKHQDRIYEMFGKVRVFVQLKDELFTPGSNAANTATKLVKIIGDLDEEIAIQRLHSASSQKHTLLKNDISEALRERLQRIADVARLLRQNIPDIMDRFRFSRGESDAVLLHTARAFAEHAEPLKDTFLKYEMPADFVEDLYTRIRKIEQLLTDRTAARSLVKRSTSNIAAGVKQGLFVVAELDVIIRNRFSHDSSVMEQWRVSSHVRKIPRKRKAAAAAQQEGQSNAE